MWHIIYNIIYVLLDKSIFSPIYVNFFIIIYFEVDSSVTQAGHELSASVIQVLGVNNDAWLGFSIFFFLIFYFSYVLNSLLIVLVFDGQLCEVISFYLYVGSGD